MYSDKFKNLVLYILNSDDYVDGGIKKLNKILYFYRDNEKFISDASYAKANMGPIVHGYKMIFEEMEKDKILFKNNCCGVFFHKPIMNPDVSIFSSKELDHLHKVLKKYGHLTSAELESISHEQQPWILTENFGDIIDRDLALLMNDEEDCEYSLDNEALKNEIEALANSVC
ncbi:MAG: type II toxin-antitoxin system antitoxin SocA domain-containing protein [Candidatus Magasanikbacteria bacterium]